MRLNSKIVSVIISLAFVGGMFSAVYAGSVIATITLDGNVHTTGDSIVDGDLSVGGVSFAALDARIAALEVSTVPMVVANEAMIAAHDTTLTSHDAMILSNQADIATNAAAIEAGGGGPNPCDPDGDGAITPQEMFDYMILIGFPGPFTILDVTTAIDNIESLVISPVLNSILDTDAEITSWNLQNLIPLGLPACPLP